MCSDIRLAERVFRRSWLDNTTDTSGCFQKIVRHEIGREPGGFKIAAVAGAHQDRAGSAIPAEVDVGRLVADDEGVPQVESEIRSSSEGEQRLGLAAFAVVLGDVRTVVERIDPDASGGELALQLGVNFGECFEGQLSAPDAGLVSHNDKTKPGLSQASQAFEGARQQFDARGGGQVVLLDDDGAVAIEEDVIHCSLGFVPLVLGAYGEMYNLLYTWNMQEINVSEFRQQCLTLMDKLPAEGIVITKRGRPIARLTPIRKSPAELIGSCPGMVIDPNDDLFSTVIKRDAES